MRSDFSLSPAAGAPGRFSAAEPSSRGSEPVEGSLRWPRKVVLLGDPASKRTRAFVAAARGLGAEVAVISFADFFHKRRSPPPPGTLVRIESPGDDPAAARAILQAGASPLEERGGRPLSMKEIDGLPIGRGEPPPALQWYLGFWALMRDLEAEWGGAGVRWMSTPAAVAATFDKTALLDAWSAAGLPTPPRGPAVSTYDALRAAVAKRHGRLFVKLRYGYAAVGAVALEWQGDRVRALTAMEVDRSGPTPRLFVTKKPQVLLDEREIAWLIDRLGQEEILVEEWLPKARYQGIPFDLRLVVVQGEVRHVVGRACHAPFTNLNLGARRIAREVVLERLGDAWPQAQSLAEQAAAILPEAGSLGVDLLVRPGRGRFALLEANSFGDYLPGLEHDGMSTYEAELRAFLPATADAVPPEGGV